MNLQKLFEMQRVLDANITAKHPVQDSEDRLSKKILALQVELGELANEWRGFKFWSTKQEARTKVEHLCVQCDGKGFREAHDPFDPFEIFSTQEQCEDCEGTGKIGESNPLLEEYVDVLHFILSIGIETKYTAVEVGGLPSDEPLEIQFNEMFLSVSNFYVQNSIFRYEQMLKVFISLGASLGFTWEEIEVAYYSKNDENHARQERGY